MPTGDRDTRREKHRRTGQQWAQWLSGVLEQEGIDASGLAKMGGERIDRASVTHWLQGENVPSPETTLLLAKLLDRSPVEVLHAAGHDVLSDMLAASMEAALRGRIADLDSELDVRLARIKGDTEEQVGEPVPEQPSTPEPMFDDPIFTLVLLAEFSEDEKTELLAMRAADLNRLEADAQAAEDRMRAIIAERVALAANGPSPAQVRAALAEFQDIESLRVWDRFLDRHYAKARDTGSFDLLAKFLADSWNTVLIYRKVQREGAPPLEQRVSGEEFTAAWERAHPGKKLAA